MKIIILSDPNSVHTVKWVKSLAQKKIEIYIFGFSCCDQKIYENYSNVHVMTLDLSQSIIRRNSSNMAKLRYFSALPKLKKLIRQFKPDILHAHYASSYGILGALSGFHPFILSVWGSDIYNFPNRSYLHKKIIEFNLSKADSLLSTSLAMAKETRKYTSKEIQVTPFGIDSEVFRPMAVENPFSKQDIVIGTVKTLEINYGIEYLIRAFKMVKDRHPRKSLKLMIVGGGSQEFYLKKLAKELSIETETHFLGRVPYSECPKYHNMLSISVFVSVSESFGVAVLEASACEKPVVVSRVGGLPEVVEDGVSGIVVPPRDVLATANAIERLVLDEELRSSMGRAGRERVQRMYDWNINVAQMINIYNTLLINE